MASFRISIDRLPGKSSTWQHYIGIDFNLEERETVAQALLAIGGDTMRGLAAMVTRQDKRTEFYVADLDQFPGDIAEMGIDRLRAKLLAAGFRDMLEAA